MVKNPNSYCRLTPLQACDHAAKVVRKAGFVFHHAAQNGNVSTYYEYPGRVGYLRISTHRPAKKSVRMVHAINSVSHLTFSHKTVMDDGTLQIKLTALEAQIAYAIGRFMITSELKPVSN